MAFTLTPQKLVDYARIHNKLVPLVGVGGFTNEPALTITYDCLMALVERPYNWKWNRGSFSFDTVENTQEVALKTSSYGTDVTGIGWLERAYLEYKADTNTPKQKFQLDCVQNNQISDYKCRPQKISFETEYLRTGTTYDSKLRFDTVPDSVIYTCYVDYQKAAPVVSSLSQTLAPIPDDMGDILRQAFIAHAYRFVDDKRAYFEFQRLEQMIQDKLGYLDAEQEGITCFPERPIMWS